jgi:hypothetical protein
MATESDEDAIPATYTAMQEALRDERWADARQAAEVLVAWLDGNRFRTIGFETRAHSYAACVFAQTLANRMLALA